MRTSRLICSWLVVVVTVATTGVWALGQANRPQAASAPAASVPATTAPAYPPPTLVLACQETAEEWKGKLDASFAFEVCPPFVIAGNLPAETLRQYAAGSIVRPAAAMWASYFQKRPDRVITVLLLADGVSYRHWAKRLFDDNDISYYGYYKPDIRTLVMNISTGSGTLVHELTHSLIVYDFPEVPTWFNEGLASLHEQCQVLDRSVVGLENWRLPALQEAISKSTLRPLRELVTERDFYGQFKGVNYAQARYFCMYMQKQGLLEDFYKYFRRHHTAKDADVKAVEHIFGKDIDEVEKAYLAWVKTIAFRR